MVTVVNPSPPLGGIQPFADAQGIAAVLEAVQVELVDQLCDSAALKLDLAARLRQRLISAVESSSLMTRALQERSQAARRDDEVLLGPDKESADRFLAELESFGLHLELDGPVRYPVVISRPGQPHEFRWMTEQERKQLEEPYEEAGPDGPVRRTPTVMEQDLQSNDLWNSLVSVCPDVTVLSEPDNEVFVYRDGVSYHCLDERATPLLERKDIDALLARVPAAVDTVAFDLDAATRDVEPYIRKLHETIASADGSGQQMNRDIERLDALLAEDSRWTDRRIADLRRDLAEPRPGHREPDPMPPARALLVPRG